MNCIMPRPSEVINQFNNLKEVSSKDATDYFYDLSVASNYIRKKEPIKISDLKNSISMVI